MPNGNINILKGLLAGLSGAGGQINASQSMGVDKIRQDVEKAISKKMQSQAIEAMDQGMPTNEVLKMLNTMLPKEGSNVQDSQIGQQGINNLEAVQDSSKQNEINQLAQAFIGKQRNIDPVPERKSFLGFTESSSTRQRELQNAIYEQQLRGEVPLQKGDIQKIQIENAASHIESLRKLEQDKSLKPQDIFNRFEEASKPFIEVRDGFARIQSAFPDLDFNSNAGDLDLLFGTAKTLDPSGRVTDADIAIQDLATGKFGDKFTRNAAQVFMRTGILKPEQRKMLYQAAQRRFQAAERNQNKTTKEFSKIAKENFGEDFNVRKLIRDVGAVEQNQETKQQSQWLKTSSGIKYQFVQ